jgi:uncharacterized protein (TIGR02099 family)
MKSETYNMQTESEREPQRPVAAPGRAAPWLIGLLEVLAWAALIVFAAVFLAARYWILPNIERYRDDIVAVISQAVGLRVEIGAIRADWHGLRPELDFSDVRLYDSRGRVALALPEVENVVAWSSLLFGDLRLQSLTVSGPRLSVRRDASGRLHVAGIALAPGADERGFTNWLLQQRDVIVRDAEITWVDEQRGAPPLVLSELNFRLRNAGARHLLGIAARPPAALGTTLELRAELQGASVTEPPAWSGRVFAEFGYTDLAGWSPWIDYPVEMRRGKGALRLWATLGSGRVLHATADLALTDVAVRLGPQLPLLELSALRGRLEGRMGVGEYEVGARNLMLLREGGAAMRSTSFRLSWSPAAANQLEHGLLTANLIELEPLAQLAEYLPIPAELRQRVAELAPRGNLLDLRFRWSGRLPDATSFNARGRFTDLGMKAWHNIPGFEGISGGLEADQARGTLRLDSRKSELELPKIFPEPRIQLDALNGNVEWTRPSQDTLEVRLSSVAFANADLAGSAFGTYRFGGAGPGVIDLSAQLSRADGRRLQKYLPLGRIMGAKTRDWLAGSILAGEASDVRLRLRGDLRDFPFADPAKGDFLVAARVENGVLDYADGWPRIEGIDGELRFERDHMEIVGRSGSILGAALTNMRVEIPSLLAGAKQIKISGEASGPSARFLAYIAASPVRRMVGGLTDDVRATGAGSLKLKLELPVDDLKASKVDGEFRFADNTVDLGHQLPPVEQAAGRVQFTESSFKLSDARGRLLGGPVSFSGGSAAGNGVQIDARGTANVAGLTGLLGSPWDRRISGTLAYDARVTAAEGRAQLAVDSRLVGVKSALPAPLDKAAGDALPLRVEIATTDGESRQRISISLGGRLVGEFERRLEGAAMALRRASIEFGPTSGRTLRVPERPGILLYGSLAALDLDSWRALFPDSGAGPGPTALDLTLRTLDAFGKRLNDVTLRGNTDTGGWSANVRSAEITGDLDYRTAEGGKLVARLARLRIPDDAPGAASEPVVQARDLPAVDLVADDFTFRGKNLGRVEFAAQRSGADWRVDRLAMQNPDASMTGKGDWRTGAPAATSLEFQLDAKDVGKFLERIGYPGLVKGGTAKLSGSLSWRGAPMSLDYPTLAGELQLRADDGQFLEIEPGIGKLVSLMSLQMLPRRIQLDFRDVFSKGFQFESITSSLQVRDGVMRTSDFKMKGSAAEVELAGETDLVRETQDVKVRVVPSLGDSASTVVGLIHPLAGVATLLAQRVLRDPLGQIFSYRYSITGTWADPKVERLGVAAPGAATDGGEGK